MLEFDEIQGNVLKGYRFPQARFLFATVEDQEGGRAWVGGVVSRISFATDWGLARPDHAINISLTYQGLAALGLPSESLDSFPKEFQEGMASSAERLGDTGESGPLRWEAGLGTPDRISQTHLMVSIYATNSSVLARQVDQLKDSMAAASIMLLYEQDACLLSGGKDHFGFVDGISQPPIVDSGDPGRPGDGLPLPDGTWKPSAAGEFVLGYPAQDGAQLPVPYPANEFGRNGTYLVYRKLHQDVALFRQYLAKSATSLRIDEEWIASRIVGRWRDGTPVELSPNSPNPLIAGDPNRVNLFNYASDSKGMRCPLGAHIRRSNPRDSLSGGVAAVEGHRLIRRGLPYGPALAEGFDDDRVDRGLIFIALNANIRDQFEFVQKQWMRSGGFINLDPEQKDVIVGDNDGTGRMVIPMPGFPRHLVELPRFVTVRFGVYLFVPSRSALKFLAENR